MRYYIAAKLNSKIEDIDLNLQDFISRVNSDLVGKYVNIAARASGFIAKRFEGRLKDVSGSALLAKLAAESDTIAEQYENREYARALRDIMALADAVNEYVDANKPWELAKQEGQDERLHEVCSELINAFTMLTAYLAPVLPQTAANAARFLNLDVITWANTRETLGEHAINKYEHLMQRVEQKQVDDLIEANKQSIQTTPAPAAEESKYEKVAEQASFDDFMKIDMRVAKVLNCEAVEGSTKLLKFDLDFGFEKRIIFSGIAASYPNPAELNGRMVIAVANFAPRKMAKFGVSEGMILSAATAEGKLKLLDVDAGAQPGDKVG
jgi:methionine--tRNA ligase, beta subunit